MDSHDLARKLLSQPNGDVTASVDVSTSEEDAFSRVFGHELSCIQVESNDSITLIFESFDRNY